MNIALKIVVTAWLLSITWQASAHTGIHGECEANCFKTEVINIAQLDEGCAEYELKVSLKGDCAHALSHYTVEVPTCARISDVSNSEGWKQEIGNTDPTTGLYGFKIDDIQGFGEDNDDRNFFIVKFTICEGESCEDLSCWAPRVAYKASTCVYYEDTEVTCANLSAHLTTQNPTCNGSADGAVSVIIDEGKEPYTFSWSNGATSSLISNVKAGNYTVIVSDAAGATVELSTTLNEPEAIDVTGTITNASCAGSDDGNIGLSVSGGSGIYKFSWSTGDTTAIIQDLAAGSYFVTVSDSSGCAINKRFTIANDVNIVVEGVVTKSSCSSNNGAIDITVSGGAEPYTFAWSNGDTTADIRDLSPTMYRLTVTDANGCTVNKSFIVQENNPIILTATTTRTGCVDDSSGSIDLTVTGGVGPYTFVWSNGETTEDITNLREGLYTVEVTDQNGCTRTLRGVISTQTFDVLADITPTICAGAENGSIDLTPSGGVSPYTFSWSNGASGSSVDSLATGLYRVTVTDAAGCEKLLTYYVNQPSPIQASASVSNASCGEGDFNIDLTISGGSGEYTYSWSNGSNSEDVYSLDSGTYVVTIIDSNGCNLEHAVVVSLATAGCDTTDGGDDTGDDGDPGTGDDTGDDGSGGDGGSGDGPGGDNTNDGDSDSGDGDPGSGGDTDDGSDNGNDGGIDDHPNDTGCYNPFYSDIHLVEVNDGCYTYQLTVNYDGQHVHGLSHLSVAIACGEFNNADSDDNWPIEVGTDPTTGISGFKFDDISGFGEGAVGDSFEATFTVCTTDDTCANILQEADFEIAYKYGQCKSYEYVDGKTTLVGDVKAYPNPFREQMTIEFASPVATEAVVELYNQMGYKIKTVYEGEVKANRLNQFVIDGTALPNDIYTYQISTGFGVYHGKVVKY